jgi:hypothetical protein
MSWTSERPTLPGFYWFNGMVEGKFRAREVMLSTVVELTGASPNLHVWFPKSPGSVHLSACEGRWAGPLEIP